MDSVCRHLRKRVWVGQSGEPEGTSVVRDRTFPTDEVESANLVGQDEVDARGSGVDPASLIYLPFLAFGKFTVNRLQHYCSSKNSG